MDENLVPMLSRMAEKVSKMRPVPPTDNLMDPTWSKVDKLILKTMKVMKDRGVKRPLHPLSETFFDMAMQDVVDNYPETTPGLQAVAYRAMDTRLLVDEFGRMRAEANAIMSVARGEKDVKVPFANFPPESPALIPPCFDERVYNDSAVGIVTTFAEELRKREILPPKKED